MAHVMNNTKLSSLDDLFKSSGVGSDNHRNIVEIPLSELHEFKGHPFRVLDDENMALLVESVKDNIDWITGLNAGGNLLFRKKNVLICCGHFFIF